MTFIHCKMNMLSKILPNSGITEGPIGVTINSKENHTFIVG